LLCEYHLQSFIILNLHLFLLLFIPCFSGGANGPGATTSTSGRNRPTAILTDDQQPQQQQQDIRDIEIGTAIPSDPIIGLDVVTTAVPVDAGTTANSIASGNTNNNLNNNFNTGKVFPDVDIGRRLPVPGIRQPAVLARLRKRREAEGVHPRMLKVPAFLQSLDKAVTSVQPHNEPILSDRNVGFSSVSSQQQMAWFVNNQQEWPDNSNLQAFFNSNQPAGSNSNRQSLVESYQQYVSNSNQPAWSNNNRQYLPNSNQQSLSNNNQQSLSNSYQQEGSNNNQQEGSNKNQQAGSNSNHMTWLDNDHMAWSMNMPVKSSDQQETTSPPTPSTSLKPAVEETSLVVTPQTILSKIGQGN
jgi:hypothetical protein